MDRLDNEPDGEPSPTKKAIYNKQYYKEHSEDLKARARIRAKIGADKKRAEDPEAYRLERKEYMRQWRARRKLQSLII